jgi:hypothetical protein
MAPLGLLVVAVQLLWCLTCAARICGIRTGFCGSRIPQGGLKT